jgi:hypothetical protein
MKSKRNSLAGPILSLALLALPFTFGGAVHAADPEGSTLQNIVFEPLTKIVDGIEQRLASLEATVIAFAGSFTSAHITTQQLCVADDGGEKTCITKAQLDALLKQLPQITKAMVEPAPEPIHEADASLPAPDASAPIVEAVAAVVAEVTVTASIAMPGEPPQKDDESLITGTVTPAAAAVAPDLAMPDLAMPDLAPEATMPAVEGTQ